MARVPVKPVRHRHVPVVLIKLVKHQLCVLPQRCRENHHLKLRRQCRQELLLAGMLKDVELNLRAVDHSPHDEVVMLRHRRGLSGPESRPGRRTLSSFFGGRAVAEDGKSWCYRRLGRIRLYEQMQRDPRKLGSPNRWAPVLFWSS
ncbi:hypothetical protein S83_048093 [Arachis hypogaea]|nr:uncharacterized protein DS421_14g471600 [Arachis hypogaea]